jgi:DNA-binding transcriptional LysR family regulator
MNFRSLDLNLLRIFHSLLSERKVSAAAEVLGLTQPAVSNALKRLRDLTGDELFTRTPAGMQPTQYALQIAEPISYSLAALESTFNASKAFDPVASDRTFVIGATDIGEAYLLPKIVSRALAIAPHVNLATRRIGSETLRDAMERGLVDVAVGLLPSLQGNFFRRRLLLQRYVVCFRTLHPLAGRDSWSVQDFLDQEHVRVTAAGTGHGAVDQHMARIGAIRRIRLTIPHFLALGPVLQGSDLVATIPETLASILSGPYGLTSVPHPIELPRVSIDLFWHRRQQRDPANIWLRTLLVDSTHPVQ